MQVDERYYTTDEVSELLQIDRDQVSKLIHNGQLEAFNLATTANPQKPRWRIPQKAIGKLLIARISPSLAEPSRKRSIPKKSAPKAFFS